MNKLNIETFNQTFKIILITLKNKLTKIRKTIQMKMANMKLQKKTVCCKKNMMSSWKKSKTNQNLWKPNYKKKKLELKQLRLKWKNNWNLRLSCTKKTAQKRRRRKRNWHKSWMITNLGSMNLTRVWNNQKKLCKLMKKKLRVWIDRLLN